jgi:6-phosphogluconolactonase (cycloisomerase 2 family)
VTQYTIDPASGNLTFVGTVPTDAGPIAATIDPTGKFAYVTCSTLGGLDIFQIDAVSGVLKPNGSLVTGPVGSSHLGSCSCHPSGKYLYATDAVVGKLYGYAVDPTTGSLTSLPASPYAVAASSIAFDLTGKFAFVTLTTGKVATLAVGSTGDLTLLGTQPAATGYTGAVGPGSFNPVGTVSIIRVEPTNRFAYGLTPIIGAKSQISVYAIDPVNGLVFTGLSNLALTGDTAATLAIAPNAKFLYSDDSGATRAVHPFAIDPRSGFLTATATPIPTGDPNATSPGPRGQDTLSLAIDRSGRFAYATSVGNFTDAAISIFKLDSASGAITFTGTVICPGAWNVTTD